MSFETISSWFAEHYNWAASLVWLVAAVLLTKAGVWLAFRNEHLQRMRDWNRKEDKPKMANPKWRPIAKANQRIGGATHLFLILVAAPLTLTLSALPWWRYLVDIVVLLLVYDFIYYLSHRFWFHGNWMPMRKAHALHHQARSPSWSDAHYVHPAETFIGLAIFVISLFLTQAIMGDIHALVAAAGYVIWTQINTINHTKFNLDFFPFKTIDYLTTKHHIHHIDMHHGNYSSITPLYDWMFGTLE